MSWPSYPVLSRKKRRAEGPAALRSVGHIEPAGSMQHGLSKNNEKLTLVKTQRLQIFA